MAVAPRPFLKNSLDFVSRLNEHRAMAGLSMGGMQTWRIAPAHLDKFSHIYVFSGGSTAVTNIADMAKFKEKVILFGEQSQHQS